MSGLVDNHPLARDIPEYKDQIHELKQSTAHFSNLMEKYEALDKDIVRAEQGVDNIESLELDGMKMKRVQLKDQLVEQLRNTQ